MNTDLGSFCVHSQWTLETWKHFSPFRVLSLNTGHSSSLLASYSFLMALVLLLIPHEIIAIDLIAILVSPWLFNLTSVGLRRPWFNFWVAKSLWRRDRLPTPVFLGFLVAQLIKKPPAMREIWVWSLGWDDPLEKGYPLHILAWRWYIYVCVCVCIYIYIYIYIYTVHGVAKSQTWQNDFHFTVLS